MIPSATSGCPSRASAVANRRSHANASSDPPPRAIPRTSAIDTFGHVRSRSKSTLIGAGASPPPCASGDMSRIIWTSACATKNSGSALVITSTRVASSLSNPWNSPTRSGTSAWSHRLIGGWSITAHATPSATSTAMCSNRSYAIVRPTPQSGIGGSHCTPLMWLPPSANIVIPVM